MSNVNITDDTFQFNKIHLSDGVEYNVCDKTTRDAVKNIQISLDLEYPNDNNDDYPKQGDNWQTSINKLHNNILDIKNLLNNINNTNQSILKISNINNLNNETKNLHNESLNIQNNDTYILILSKLYNIILDNELICTKALIELNNKIDANK